MEAALEIQVNKQTNKQQKNYRKASFSMTFANRFVVSKEEGGRSGMNGDLGVGRCKLLHLEWISNEVLLYCTGHYIQSLGIEHDGR